MNQEYIIQLINALTPLIVVVASLVTNGRVISRLETDISIYARDLTKLSFRMAKLEEKK